LLQSGSKRGPNPAELVKSGDRKMTHIRSTRRKITLAAATILAVAEFAAQADEFHFSFDDKALTRPDETIALLHRLDRAIDNACDLRARSSHTVREAEAACRVKLTRMAAAKLMQSCSAIAGCKEDGLIGAYLRAAQRQTG